MRFSIYAVLVATVLSAALSVSAAAQKFQEPSREELQMTSDPKAPGAAAVYLELKEETNNRSHFVSRYARIKVLAEQGKEYATVEVPYIPGYTAVPIIEARTIHADGTVIPLAGKPEELLVVKTSSSHLKVSVFNLPSVEVGSVLEYRWTVPMTGGKTTGVYDPSIEGYLDSALASSTPEWEVQQPIFVHKASYYFQPNSDLDTNVLGTQVTRYVNGERASYLLYSQRLPAGFQVQHSPAGDFTLEIRDVPAIPREQHTPPEDAARYRVRFYYTPYVSAQVFWDNERKRWSKQLDEFAGVNDTIRGAAAQITAGADTPAAKAQKIYDAVQGLENADFARVKDESERKALHVKAEVKSAAEVWNEKSGSGNDLAALYLALAHADGLDARGVQVANRSRRIFDNNYLTLSQLDGLVIVLRLDGKDIYLDPGEKLCPFGQLAWQHSLAGGLDQGNPGPAVTPPNSTKDAITAHAAELTIDAQGNASGAVKVLMNGPEALHWRQAGLRQDADEVSKEIKESLTQTLPKGFNVEITGIQGMSTSQGYLSVMAKVNGSLGTVTGKRIVVPAFLFSTDAHTEFVSDEKRERPVDMHFAEQVIDDAIYHLPAGYTVEGAPQAVQLAWPEHAALVVKTQPGPGTLDIKHIFVRAFVLLDAKEYGALRDYYQKVAANDQQQVVLTSGVAASQ
jgi:hypothetical protein